MKTLLYIVGPPAAGKMTVGAAIAARTGLRLFHNHMAIEPVLPFFAFGTPPFHRLVDGFRSRLIEEVAASDLPGLIFTYVWAFDHPADARAVAAWSEPFRRRGGRILFLELAAGQEERLRRNEGASRLAAKPSKRDLAWSRDNLLESDRRYRFNSAGEFDGRDDHLRIDNTDLAAEAVAELVIRRFGLNEGPDEDPGEGPGEGPDEGPDG